VEAGTRLPTGAEKAVVARKTRENAVFIFRLKKQKSFLNIYTEGTCDQSSHDENRLCMRGFGVSYDVTLTLSLLLLSHCSPTFYLLLLCMYFSARHTEHGVISTTSRHFGHMASL
jgi:hypothetical protein